MKCTNRELINVLHNGGVTLARDVDAHIFPDLNFQSLHHESEVALLRRTAVDYYSCMIVNILTISS